jgi:hypothetical protein
MATFINVTGVFTIRELSGERRTLNLGEAAQPYRPFTLEGEQRLSTTWYPGSPVATAQVLGAKENQTVVRGFWKDRRLSRPGTDPGNNDAPATLDGTALITSVDLADAVDDIRRKGSLIEVVWLHVVRVGFIQRFQQSWHNQHDVEWELTFEWIAKDQDNQAVAFGRREVDMSETIRVSATDVNGVGDLFATAPDLSPAFLDEASVALNGLYEATLDLQVAVAGSVSGFLSPFDALRRMVAGLGFIVTDTAALLERQYARADGQMLMLGTPNELLSDLTAGEYASAMVTNRRVTRQARRTRHNAARAQAQAVRSIEPDLAATFSAREDDDLRQVSTRFYGTPDEWQRLARFNNLRSSKLRAGQVVMVPRSFQAER